MTKTEPFDAADYLETDQDIAGYLSEALATRDPAVIALALGAATRARGIARVARRAGLSEATLCRALRPDGNTDLATVLRIIEALGLRLGVQLAARPARVEVE